MSTVVCKHTTKMMPSSLTKVHLRVCCSVLYGALLAAELFALRAPEALFSSTNTSVMKLLMTEGLMGAHLRDHTTTPEVVTISNVSNMVFVSCGDRAAAWRVDGSEDEEKSEYSVAVEMATIEVRCQSRAVG